MMGQLIDGKWSTEWYDTKSTGGKFERSKAGFRNWITPDGSAGPSGQGGFKAEAGRYHLYVSLACPWAHRTLIFRKLKQLEEAISVSVVEPVMSSEGWAFSSKCPDHVNGSSRLHQLYTRADPQYSGRVSVPVLWDKRTATIVNNESAEIIRMLNDAFGTPTADYYPAALRRGIDEVNALVYE